MVYRKYLHQMRIDLEHFLAPIFAESTKIQQGHHLTHSQEYIMMGVSTVLIIGIILYAVSKFRKGDYCSKPKAQV